MPHTPPSFSQNASGGPPASQELDVAKSAASAAADVIRKFHHDGFAVHTKEGSTEDVDMVSEADLAAEQTIVQAIRETFPTHAFLAEETFSAPADAPHLWVIDPLDGTTNFVHGIPHVGISIAYYQSGQPVCAVVVNPLRGDWYVAQRGGGAWVNGVAARVADHSKLTESLVGVGFYYDRGAMMQATLAAVSDLFHNNIHGIRRFGTASLDLCMVGCGHVGAFFEYQLSPWDFAAGRLFVEEAGGRVTTCDGNELPLAVTTLLASNGLLHEPVVEITSKHMLGRST